MRIGRIVITAGLLASTLAVAGCYDDRPGRWGDHHHRGHHGHHGHHDRGDHHRGDHDWRR
ncbi:MAG TPA: hypothetical protein VM657_09170 [Sphingomonas sp.]|nr:hypothetical protein [Sphingomonas sp.]